MNGQVRKVADEDDQYHQFHNLFGSDVITVLFLQVIHMEGAPCLIHSILSC